MKSGNAFDLFCIAAAVTALWCVLLPLAWLAERSRIIERLDEQLDNEEPCSPSESAWRGARGPEDA